MLSVHRRGVPPLFSLDITDPIANLTHQFVGGPSPAVPGKDTCGADPTEDDLTCDSFAACEA